MHISRLWRNLNEIQSQLLNTLVIYVSTSNNWGCIQNNNKATKLVVAIAYSDFQPCHMGQFLLVWPGLLHFEHFLVVLEPVSASVWTAVAASCCKVSCSAPAQKFVNIYVTQVVSNMWSVIMIPFWKGEWSRFWTFPADSPWKQSNWCISQYGKCQDYSNITLPANPCQTDLNEQHVKCSRLLWLDKISKKHHLNCMWQKGTVSVGKSWILFLFPYFSLYASTADSLSTRSSNWALSGSGALAEYLLYISAISGLVRVNRSCFISST